MTDERDQTSIASRDASAAPAAKMAISRRQLLRGASAVVPTILTLNSPLAAAVARTSNEISLAYSADKDVLDRHLCVDLTNPVHPRYIEGTRYDLGEPATANITAIPDSKAGVPRVYRTAPIQDSSSGPVDGPYICENGGTYYYEVPNATGDGVDFVETAPVPKGMMASAIALSSYTGSGITTTEI